jgi:hypothetical protein
VEGVDRHADHGSCGEETATKNKAACAEEYHNTQIFTSRGRTFRNYTREAKRNGRVDAQPLFDTSVEVREVLHLLACCHEVVIHPVLITGKLFLETRLWLPSIHDEDSIVINWQYMPNKIILSIYIYM